jgi:predicted ArsR family transcriptional regulator
VVTGCVCAFADVSEPPVSLCHYCCKHFQETYFKALLGREVEVEITAAFMLGDERCNTVIKIL